MGLPRCVSATTPDRDFIADLVLVDILVISKQFDQVVHNLSSHFGRGNRARYDCPAVACEDGHVKRPLEHADMLVQVPKNLDHLLDCLKFYRQFRIFQS